MPHRTTPELFTSGVESEHITQQRIQWALWKVLGPRLDMDPERFSRLAEALASDLYAAGIRFPAQVDASIVARRLSLELGSLVRDSPEYKDDPKPRVVRRLALVSTFLAHSGWRKVLGAAIMLTAWWPDICVVFPRNG